MLSRFQKLELAAWSRFQREPISSDENALIDSVIADARWPFEPIHYPTADLKRLRAAMMAASIQAQRQQPKESRP